MSRLEQTRMLSKRLVGQAIAVCLCYTIAFAAAAWLFDRYAAPAIGEAVAELVAPWEYVPDAAWSESSDQQIQREVQADIVRSYLNLLAQQSIRDAHMSLALPEGGESPSDANEAAASGGDAASETGSAEPAETSGATAPGGADAEGSPAAESEPGSGETEVSPAETDAVAEGMPELEVINDFGGADVIAALGGWTIEEAAAAALEAPDVANAVSSTGTVVRDESGNELSVAQYAAALTARARADGFAAAREQGLTLTEDYDATISGEGALPSQSYADWLLSNSSAQARDLVRIALEMRNAGAAGSVRDALWLITERLYADRDLLLALYPEAQSSRNADYSQMVVYRSTNGSIEQVIYADGHAERRDLTTYESLKDLKLPLAIALLCIGFIVIVALFVWRSLGCFDTLLAGVKGLLSDDEPKPLPKKLTLAQETLDDVRRKNALDARAAEMAEERKNEMVAYLAHDTKTPLTAITGFLSLLDEAPDMPDEQRQRYVRTALEKSYRLDGMLDEFFEITRYNLHAIPIERAWVDPALLCFQVADEFFPDASAREIALEVDAAEGTEVFADADKLSRALSNVVKNAVAYADARTTIFVRMVLAECEPAADGAAASSEQKRPCRDMATPLNAGDGDSAVGPTPSAPPRKPHVVRMLSIEVENEGREITPEHLKRIFEKFYREDSARGANQGGAGLGLAIAREIVQAHGGTITATSENGTTTFTLSLPVATR